MSHVIERRKGDRFAILAEARVFQNDRFVADVMITDLSTASARLQTSMVLPARFTLRLNDGRQAMVDYLWRIDDQVGVQFCEPLRPARVTPGDQPFVERRKDDRLTVLSEARIFQNDRFVADVLIKDLSANGARIQTSSDLPARFTLRLIDGRQTIVDYLWRIDDQVGVRFREPLRPTHAGAV
jgi:hypothetical protein